MSKRFTDEELMAYADGQCDPDVAARIEAAAAHNPDIAKRIALFTNTTHMLKQAMPPKADASRDDDLAAIIRKLEKPDAAPSKPDNVVQFPRREKPKPQWWQQAGAAAAVLIVVLAGSYLMSTPGPGPGPKPVGQQIMALTADVEAVLGNQPSGSVTKTAAGDVTVIASFDDGKGHFCREYELAVAAQPKLTGVACKAGESWQNKLLATMPSTGESFTPAGSAQALEAYLNASGMIEPLTPEAEKELLEAK